MNYLDESKKVRYLHIMAIENHQLVDIIRRRQGRQTLGAFAKSIAVQPTYLSEVMNGIRPVGDPLARKFGYARMKVIKVMFAKTAGAK